MREYKMWRLWSVVLLLGVSLSEGIDVNLVANAPHIFVHPPRDHQRDTTWNVRAPRGSKIIAACISQELDCRKLQFIVNNGEGEEVYCGPDNRVFFTGSATGLLTITYTSVVGPSKGYCQLSATLPYLHHRPPVFDSSEHGTFAGKSSPSCKCGWTNKEGGQRIVNGMETLPNEYPFPVLLLTGDRRSRFCGGSIISPYHVLTAAHCTWPKQGEKLAVMVGLHDLSSYNPYSKIIDVDRWIDHPNYDNNTNVNDISIMVLKQKIDFNGFVGPVCLPKKRYDLQHKYIKVMGWGKLATKGESSQVLRKVNLRVIEDDICKTVYSRMDTKQSQICTHDHMRDSCQGDSGGPLVYLDPEYNRYVQVALVSYGRDCASADPAVNTDVWHFMPWITKTIADTKPEKTCS